MTRKLAYDEEIMQLHLIDEVSTNDKSIDEDDDEFSDCDERISEHNTSSEEEIKSDEVDATESSSVDCFIGKDGKKYGRKQNFVKMLEIYRKILFESCLSMLEGQKRIFSSRVLEFFYWMKTS